MLSSSLGSTIPVSSRALAVPGATLTRAHPAARLVRAYLFVGAVLYLAFALLTPPFQTPDEHQHLFRAYQLASFELIGERRGQESGGELPESLSRAALPELGTLAPHVDRAIPETTFAQRIARATPLDASGPRRFTNFLGSVSYAPVGYVPQIVAIWTGGALGFSVENIVRLGRVFNALVCLGLFAGALRCLPVGRLALLFLALLPMTASCAGAFGQDGMVIGAGAWLAALGVRIALLRSWSGRELALAALLTACVTLAKMVYLPLVLLPVVAGSGVVREPRWYLPPVLIALPVLALLGWWLALNSGLYVAMKPGMPAPGEQVAYLLGHPLAFPKALAVTYLVRGGAVLDTLFTFGWLNVGPVVAAQWLSAIALGIVLWQGDGEAGALTRAWRYWAALLVLAMIAAMTLALYIAATSAGSLLVSGIQGRYFLPLALPALVALLRHRRADERLARWAVFVLMGMANLASLLTIARAYYL